MYQLLHITAFPLSCGECSGSNDGIWFLQLRAFHASLGVAYGPLDWSLIVCTFHDGCKQGIDQQIFNRKSISSKITHLQFWKLQAKLTGEKLKGWSKRREINKLKTRIKIS